MICFTLRRSMLSSRAIARWLWPALCHARTVCSRDGVGDVTTGTSWFDAGARWCGAAPADGAAPSRCPVLISIISSSNEPASATAGQALTSAPIGPWTTPCARLAPTVATMPTARLQPASRGTRWLRRLASSITIDSLGVQSGRFGYFLSLSRSAAVRCGASLQQVRRECVGLPRWRRPEVIGAGRVAGQRRRHRHSRYAGTGAGGSTKRSASSPASSRAFRKVDSLRCVAPTRIRTPSGLWSGEVRQPSDS